MAINKRITELNPLGVAASNDVFAIVDFSAGETKKIEKSDLMATPGAIGSAAASTGRFTTLRALGNVTFDADLSVGGYSIDEFSNDGTLIGNSDTVVPTEQAVKTYVDNAVYNARRFNIIHTSTDSTAVIWDVILADDSTGNISVELQPNGEGKITVLKNSSSAYKIIVTTSSGILYDGGPLVSIELDMDYMSIEFLCDGVNFYVV